MTADRRPLAIALMGAVNAVATLTGCLAAVIWWASHRPNRLWLRLGLRLNRVISPVALGFLFYAVFTPMGALMRRFAKDNLRLRSGKIDGSYWIRRDPPGPKPDSLHNQF